MNLTLPIFKISEQSPLNKKLTPFSGLFKKLLKRHEHQQSRCNGISPASQIALMDRKSPLTRIVGHLRSELNCEGNLKIPIAPRLEKEFKLEETEVLKPPWRIPSLVS